MTLKEERKLYKEAQLLAQSFIGKPGVSDIEFGLKHTNGQLTEEFSIRFKVEEKIEVGALKKSDILPKKLGKFKTDVLSDKTVNNVARNENPNTIVRPLLGGIQIQSEIYKNTENYWGTMGGYFQIGDQLMGITNYHVLYGKMPPDLVLDAYADKLKVYQHLNRPDNQIGVATSIFSPEFDYATFILQAPVDSHQSINNRVGQLGSYAHPQINMSVWKSGAKTGMTYGIIDGRSCLDCAELSIHIDERYPNPNNILTDHGDSGALWILNEDSEILRPIALNYGGGETLQWAKAKSLASVFASIRNKTQNQFI